MKKTQEKIKAILKGDQEPPKLPEPEPAPVIAPPATQTIVQPTVVTKVVDSPQIDLDKRLKLGVTGNEVERLQVQINDTVGKLGFKRGTRMTNTWSKDWTFPLKTDGDFGEQTYNAVYANYEFFRNKGYITLDQARYDWVYWLGLNGYKFPDSLRSSKRYKRYADRYKTGKIDAQK